jgi:hypothetical protein
MSRIETTFQLSGERTSDGAWPPRETAEEVMPGLTAAETREFMALDARNHIDENGNPFQWPWDVTGAAKARWLALFEKHEAALARIKRLDRTPRRPK